jgi:hypothetical protein
MLYLSLCEDIYKLTSDPSVGKVVVNISDINEEIAKRMLVEYKPCANQKEALQWTYVQYIRARRLNVKQSIMLGHILWIFTEANGQPIPESDMQFIVSFLNATN